MNRPTAFVGAATALLGVAMLATGAWALIAPRSFAEVVATFPPYNEHLVHDAGAFQIGIGATTLLALAWRDALAVVLGGYAVGGGLHVLSHVIDRDLGGRATDPLTLAVPVLIAAVALLARRRATRRAARGRIGSADP